MALKYRQGAYGAHTAYVGTGSATQALTALLSGETGTETPAAPGVILRDTGPLAAVTPAGSPGRGWRGVRWKGSNRPQRHWGFGTRSCSKEGCAVSAPRGPGPAACEQPGMGTRAPY